MLWLLVLGIIYLLLDVILAGMPGQVSEDCTGARTKEPDILAQKSGWREVLNPLREHRELFPPRTRY